MSHIKNDLFFILKLLINIALITNGDIPINGSLLLKQNPTLIMHSLCDQNHQILIIPCQQLQSLKQQTRIELIKDEFAAND